MNRWNKKANPVRTTTTTQCIFLVGLCLCLGQAGCYPDESSGANCLNLSLELERLGITFQQQSWDNWMSWLKSSKQLGQPYQMGSDGFDFVLAIDLYSVDPASKVSFEPSSILLQQKSDQTDTLLIDTQLATCHACRFEMAVFWLEPVDTIPTLQTFWGNSALFDFDENNPQNELVMDIYLQPVGEVRCKTGSALDTQARLAARELEQNVRFQPIVPGQTETVLSNLPIQRNLLIELDPQGNGEWQSITQVKLTSQGQQLTVQLP